MMNGHRHHQHSQKRKLSSQQMMVIGVCAVLLLALLVAAVYLLGRAYEESQYQEQRGVIDAQFGAIPTVEYNGQVYARRLNQTHILLMGTDRRSDEERQGFRNGGQADYLLLLVLDHDQKTIRQLQIDRDTITQVTVLGVLGNEVGTREMQICLSHGYGGSREDNCKYAVQAVENLLEGVDIELYYALQLDSIGVLNDALGGVTVTLPEDYSAHDPEMTLGRTMTLTAAQAEIFVRGRMDIGEGTNEDRMSRHRLFMDAAVGQLETKLDEGGQFLAQVYDLLSKTADTNITRGRLINEANRAYHYDILPVENPAGEYRIGSDGFMEFHADADALLAWVMDVFYEPKN